MLLVLVSRKNEESVMTSVWGEDVIRNTHIVQAIRCYSKEIDSTW